MIASPSATSPATVRVFRPMDAIDADDASGAPYCKYSLTLLISLLRPATLALGFAFLGGACTRHVPPERATDAHDAAPLPAIADDADAAEGRGLTGYPAVLELRDAESDEKL